MKTGGPLVLGLSMMLAGAAGAGSPAGAPQEPLSPAVRRLLIDADGRSGVHPLTSGVDAFVARAALMDAARHRLDLQYYLWENDQTGRLLLRRLLAAADRGVRVRLLLDDIHSGGLDAALLALDAHPRVEVRLFNPFQYRRLRLLDYLTRFGGANRRMHNKSMTVDGLVAIIGGRNIGNEYLGYQSQLVFADLDVVGIGPMVEEAEIAFEGYWDSEWATPVAALAREDGVEPVRRLETLRRSLAGTRADPAYRRALAQGELSRALRSGELRLFWGEAEVLYDPPELIAGDDRDRPPLIGAQLREAVIRPQREVLLVSPYFVPGAKGVALLTGLAARGVRVRVLTNSLAATDVAAVHAGYARYREALLRGGVELYELKPGPGGPRELSWTGGSSRASLHAKTYAFDRDSIFVGSLNLDPRSLQLNTEMGVLLDIPALAGRLGEWFDGKADDAAYRVVLVGPPGRQRLQWLSREDGRWLRYRNDPATTPWQRAVVSAMALLPFESLL